MRLGFSPRSQQPDTMMTPRDSRARGRGQRRRDTACKLLVEPLEGRALLSAGALDTSFGGTGMVTTAIQDHANSQAVAVQSDLKVVVVGDSGKTGSTHTTIARYNGDGSLDSSFGTGGIVTNPLSNTSTLSDGAYAVAIQPADGKIVVASWDQVPAKKGPAFNDWAIVRLNANGSLDTTFGAGKGYVLTGFGAPAGTGQNVYSIALQPDGKIVAAG
jgi:uncharacterized delta-60 repeat protein